MLSRAVETDMSYPGFGWPANEGMNLTSALPRSARWHGRRSQVMPRVRPTMALRGNGAHA